jgi:hypothetical protein
MGGMVTEQVDVSEKFSLAPFFPGGFGEEKLRLPFQLADISVESVEGLLRSENFSLWSQSNYISKRTLESFERAKVALVHRFMSGYGMGKDDEDSKELLGKAFACLRVVKPTRNPFSVVQCRKQDGRFDVLGFTSPANALPINLPRSEILNDITDSDLEQLRKMWPRYRSIRDSGPEHLRRATRYYETGYSELRAGDLQFTTWVMGIEALYAEDEEPCSAGALKERILGDISPDTDIYEGRYRPSQIQSPVRLGQVLDKLVELRDRLVHGAWAPKSWFEKTVRIDITGTPVSLPDALREAASFILRTGLQKKLLVGL